MTTSRCYNHGADNNGREAVASLNQFSNGRNDKMGDDGRIWSHVPPAADAGHAASDRPKFA